MTVALAALSAVLAIGLAVALVLRGRDVESLRERIADLEQDRSTLTAELEYANTCARTSERHLEYNRIAVEAAERVRLEREWGELAGTTAPLPAGWDGTLGPALAVELELIREVVGTPSTLEVSGGDAAGAGFRIAMCAEFLRAVARNADEMRVLVDDGVVVWASTAGLGSPDGSPHLEALKRLSVVGVSEVLAEPCESGFKATMRFSDPRPGAADQA